MKLSRRSLLQGGLGVAAAVGLASCSKGGGSRKSSGEIPKEVSAWIWPSGFSKELLDYVNKTVTQTQLKQTVIGGDFKQKLSTTFSAKQGLPQITGVKGEDMPFFLEKANYFEDLNKLGFKDVESKYLDWKVAQGRSTDGKQIGFPIDIGPTVTFYRFDIFGDAKLPTDPKELEPFTKTWEDYFELGKKLLAAKPGHFLIRNVASVWSMSLNQQPMSFVNKDNEWVAAGEHVKVGWDRAVAALASGCVARIQSDTPDVQAMVNTGKLPADFGAAWHLDDLQGDAPKTAGKWHITDCPGGPANVGGSFLSIPRGTDNAEFIFKVISTMMDAKGQELEYTKKGYFPSMPETYKSAALSGENAFLGNQKAIDYFGKSAEGVKVAFKHAQDDAVGAPFSKELELVESSGKDQAKAWNDAVAASKKIAGQLGLEVS